MGRDAQGRPTGRATLLSIAFLTGGILLTANCAGSDEATSGSTGTAPGPSSSSEVSGTTAPVVTSGGTPYLPEPEPELTVTADPAARLERLSGVVAAGTESGCRLLQLEGGRAVQLIGGDARVRVGGHVTVEGRRVPGMATTCQEGTPFLVSAVIAAGSASS